MRLPTLRRRPQPLPTAESPLQPAGPPLQPAGPPQPAGTSSSAAGDPRPETGESKLLSWVQDLRETDGDRPVERT